MAHIIGSPNRYVQGAGMMAELGDYASRLGKKALVIIGEHGLERFGDILNSTFSPSSCPAVFAAFNGESSRREIDRLCRQAAEENAEVIVGIGGGKAIDTTKAAAYYAKLPCVVMPTAASSDAPCSSLSVIYTDDHRFESYLDLPSGPDMVIVDTAVIAKAPPRLLASGMGDAMATWFEARACQRADADNCIGGKVTLAAMGIAELCYRTLLDEGLKAILAAQVGACTKALEHIVETNTYLSGIGFESGGLAAAHAIHNGLTVLPQTRDLYHGEKVAFGTLSQLILEDAPEEEIQEVAEFFITLGLPVTFAELGLENIREEDLWKVAQTACAPEDTAHHMPFAVTPQSIYNAMLGADAMGRFYTGADMPEDDACMCGHHD